MSELSREYETALQLFRGFGGKSLKKFFPTLVKRGKDMVPVIYECEAFEMLPRPFNLRDGEYRFAFLKPQELTKPDDPTVTFSFFLCDSLEEAMEDHKKKIVIGLESRKSKYKEEYTQQDVEDKMKLVEFIPLK